VRVVLDTNVYVSAFLSPGGNGDQALRAAIDGRYTLLGSAPIFGELARVLHEKLRWSRQDALDAVSFAAKAAVVVAPERSVSVLAHEPDNRILECAESGAAELIVTGDHHLLDLGSYGRARIVRLTAFAARLSEAGS